MKRRTPLPQLTIDRKSGHPLHRQLAAALRRAIRTGELAPGSALPSTRALADALGLSRNTVVTAYEELAADGLILARAGSATRVFGPRAAPRIPDWRVILHSAQYPVDAAQFQDPDGNELYCHI